MKISELVIYILATWRVSNLIVEESGPWDLFAKLRGLIGVYYDEYSNPQGKNVIARAMTCTWCISVWVGLMWAVLDAVAKPAPLIALPLALSAGAIIVGRLADG